VLASTLQYKVLYTYGQRPRALEPLTPNRQMSALTEFLFPAPSQRTTGAIIRWWEGRRLAYNAWVGGAGLISLGALITTTVLFGDPLPGRFFWVPVLVFGAMANVCYLLGPALEIVIQKLWGRQVLPAGPTLFRMGLTFSVGLALLPALLAVITSVIRVAVGLF